MKPFAAIVILAGACLAGCSRSNNLLFGRVEAQVGGHRVVVTDCYRTSVPPPQQVQPGEYRFTPCRDADVLIRKDQLMVNGRSYGHISPRAAILVDHGVVSVSGANEDTAKSR
jgi:hypothetical protein